MLKADLPTTMMAGVMMANTSWKAENTVRGMVAARAGLGAPPTFLYRP